MAFADSQLSEFAFAALIGWLNIFAEPPPHYATLRRYYAITVFLSPSQPFHQQSHERRRFQSFLSPPLSYCRFRYASRC
jgi:hypothetical protein